MKRLRILATLLSLSCCLLAQEPKIGGIVTNPYAPPFLDCAHSEFPPRDQQFMRIIADINNDGIPDLALTRQLDCGNHECWWSLFLKEDNHYIYVGNLAAGEIGLLKSTERGTGRLCTYSEGSVDSGYYAVYIVSKDGITKESGRVLSARTDGRAFEQLVSDQSETWLKEQAGQCSKGAPQWASP